MIGIRVELDKQIRFRIVRMKREPPVRGIDGISLVRERRRHHFRHECPQTRKTDLIMVGYQFLDYTGQQIYIHNLQIRNCKSNKIALILKVSATEKTPSAEDKIKSMEKNKTKKT